MSVYRLALKAIVDNCIGQEAWIWVSGFRKGETEAKLEDFKMFDEASRESCSWPMFPSLAVCGACTQSLFSTSCDPQGMCSYAMPSGTTIRNQADASFEHKFTAAPSNGSSTFQISSSKAIISIFDIMLSEKASQDNQVRAYQCGLWFCLKSYNLTVTDGVVNRSVTVEWSKSDFTPKSSAHDDEYVFLDIPPEMNANRHTRYSVPLDALDTLRTFMDKLTLGNAFQVADDMIYDTDWIEALEVAARLDLSGWISRLALSLTNNIQLTGMVRPGRNSDYSGTAYIMAPYVEVNWYLVAYPLSLMVLAFVYLVQTMLFCHVSNNIYAKVGKGMDEPQGLDKSVGQTEVELIRQDNGWVFTKPRYH
ncbi:hypothetical protein F5Y07DRAFT_391530 [Xylaria sp. FL0933]|nr:hypothetical protein F5Y07DRAFT_391530 [Xylaria sp. FL0933]